MILSPNEFLDRPDMTGALGADLYPELKRHFLATFEPPERDSAILCGGMGWGRTTLGALMLYYAVHRILEADLANLPDAPIPYVSREMVMVGLMRDQIPHGFHEMAAVPYFRSKLERSSYRRLEFKGGLHVSVRTGGERGGDGGRRPLGGLIELMGYNPAATIRGYLEPMRRRRDSPGDTFLIAVMDGPPPHADARTYVAELSTWAPKPLYQGAPVFAVRYGGGGPIALLDFGAQTPWYEGEHRVDEAGYHYRKVPIDFRSDFARNPAQALWDCCGVQAL